MNVEQIGFSDEVESLLVSEKLPVSDLHNQNNVILFGILVGGNIVGIVGIELYENVGLLRSLVVKNIFRKSGLGKKLVAKAEEWAGEMGVDSIYLLTITAPSFFLQLGYEAKARSQAPAAIARSSQFTELCPVSATLMYKKLSASHMPHE
jgi:amino-acid N-acetyltransferase